MSNNTVEPAMFLYWGRARIFGFGDLQSSKKSQANKQPRTSEMGKREAAEEMEDCWDKGTVYIT